MRLFVVELRATGGMIHYAYQLCTALAEQGAEVTLVTARGYEMAGWPHNFRVVELLRMWPLHDPESDPQRARGALAKARRRLFRLARRALRAIQLVGQWIRLSAYLLRQRPDLAQFGALDFPFESLFLSFLRRRGLTLTDICHEFEMRERREGLITRLANRLYLDIFPNFAVIFLHAEENRQRLLAACDFPPQRTHVIPHGNEGLFRLKDEPETDESAIRGRYGLAPDEPVVLFFGNLTASKGLPELLDAFSLVRQQQPARLLIAGYPTKHIDLDALKQQADELGIAQAVIFDARYIPINEVGGLMRLARVVVYPYRSSSQSGSLQVAYAFGRPVVATRVGGLPEVVEQGKSGFLTDPGSREQLAEAIQRLVADEELAHQMGEYARHLSETRFSWSAIAGQIMAVYSDLLASQEKAG